MAKRKQVLNAALKALLAGVQTSAAVKIPATFISELASLPDDKQKVLAELTPEQFNELLTQSELAAINAASSAADAKQIKALLKELLDKVDRAITSVSREQSRSLIHNLPYASIGNLFKGRDKILAGLKQQLGDAKPTAIIQSIQGLGGIGKTRLAIEFGWWALENKKYHPVFFVSSQTLELLQASLAGLAKEDMLGLPGEKEQEQITSVLRWLSENRNWLMIIDNADSEEVAKAVEKLLPDLSAGRVIITSRYTRWSAAVAPHTLGLLEPKRAQEFLLERTAGRRIETPNDEEIAEKLAEEAGFLPLVLEQMGAFIAHNKCSMAEYLQQWQDEREQVLKWYDSRQMQYDVSVAVTWQRTFGQFDASARTLLRLCAFLAPEMIPTAMFEKSAKILDEAAKFQCREMGIKAKKFVLKEALSELAAYSMITREEKGFTIHRIVQQVLRSRIPQQHKRQWVQKALLLVNNFAPTESDDVRTWPVWDVLRPHAELIAETADKEKITEPTARLMNVLGEYLHSKGLYKKAEQWKRRALKIAEASFGPDHPNVATALNNLAELFRETGQFDEAEPMYRRALKIDEASFGSDHPDVARDLNNLALLLQATNCLSEAEPLMRRVVKILENPGGEPLPNYAGALNNLAELLRETNRLDEAEPMYRRVVEIFEKSLGENHPNVATALNNLAQLLQDTNRLTEAEPLMCRALKIDEASFGPDHPNVATALNNLAALLQATNRLIEAEPLMRKALKIDEASFGPDHPKVAIRLNNLAQLLQATNRLTEAEPLMKKALKIFEDSLGHDHPSTKTVRQNLQLLKSTPAP